MAAILLDACETHADAEEVAGFRTAQAGINYVTIVDDVTLVARYMVKPDAAGNPKPDTVRKLWPTSSDPVTPPKYFVISHT